MGEQDKLVWAEQSNLAALRRFKLKGTAVTILRNASKRSPRSRRLGRKLFHRWNCPPGPSFSTAGLVFRETSRMEPIIPEPWRATESDGF